MEVNKHNKNVFIQNGPEPKEAFVITKCMLKSLNQLSFILFAICSLYCLLEGGEILLIYSQASCFIPKACTVCSKLCIPTAEGRTQLSGDALL